MNDIIQFTASQFEAYRNLIFAIGLGVGCLIGGGTVMVTMILLRNSDDD